MVGVPPLLEYNKYFFMSISGKTMQFFLGDGFAWVLHLRKNNLKRYKH